MAAGNGDHDGIDEPEPDRRVLAVQTHGRIEIVVASPLDRIVPFGDVLEKGVLRGGPDVCAEQVVHFGQDCPRQYPLRGARLEGAAQGFVVAVLAIDERNDGARVSDDHGGRAARVRRAVLRPAR